MNDQQRASELLADGYDATGWLSIAKGVRSGAVGIEPHVMHAITAALRAAPEVEVVGEAWRLVNSGGDQVGGLYSSEWAASAAELKYRGSRPRTPYTVQRLEIIAARPQGVKDV